MDIIPTISHVVILLQLYHKHIHSTLYSLASVP